MNSIRTIFFLLFITFSSLTLFCQTKKDEDLPSKTIVLKDYIRQSSKYASQKKFDSANYFAKKSWQLSKEINDKNLTARVVFNNSKVLYWQAKTAEAKKLLKLNINNKKLTDRIYYKSMQLLGTIYEYEKNYKEALETFIKIEKNIYKRSILTENDSIVLSNIYFNIGYIHQNSKNTKKAHHYYDKALVYIKDSYHQASILFYKSALYERKNDFRKSINFLLKGIDISKKNKYKVLLPSYYAAISNCYIKLGKGDSAVYYGKIGLLDNTDCHLESLFNNVGKGYMLTKNYKNAINNFNKAIDYSSKKQALEIHENLRNAFISVKNYKKAIAHNEKYLAIKKLLDSLKIRQELLDITEKYESEKKQLKIEMLESENNHNNFVIQKQKTQLVLISVSFLIASMFLVFIVFSYYKEKKRKNLLFIKNNQLAQTIKDNKVMPSTLLKHRTNETSSIDTSQRKKIHSFIEEAIRREFYLDNTISLASLAKSANTNTTYLSKIINEDYQKTFVVFINELRISYTLKQLEISPKYRKLTIDNIAHKAGFSSSSAFYNAFKNFTGLTPSFYIKKRLQQELT